MLKSISEITTNPHPACDIVIKHTEAFQPCIPGVYPVKYGLTHLTYSELKF